MRGVIITGTGSFLPGEPIGNDLVEELFGTPDHYLTSLLGTKCRYWATEPHSFKLRFCNSEIAAQAIAKALITAKLEAEAVELLVLNSCTPDYLMPPMAPLVQELLNIPECAVVELRSGCVGAISALSVASQFLKTGAYNNAVVVTSELPTSYTLLPIREGRSLTIEERINGVMFGDGAGALVLVGQEGIQTGIKHICLNSIGCGRPPGMTFKAGGSKYPITSSSISEGLTVLHHDHRAVLRWGRELSLRALQDLCKLAEVPLGDIDFFIFPQANPEMLQQDIQELDALKVIPADRIVMNVDRVGNTVSAGLFIALDELVQSGRATAGARLALIAGEASKWLYGGALITM